MAELASSIVTIAQVSLAIIKETVRYIQEVRLVDTLIDRLLTEFKELHDLIKVVHSTYKHALAGEAIASSTFVGKYVEKCKDRLYQMQKLVVELASRDTDSIARKFSAQRRYKTIRKDIEMATDDIHRYIKHIRTGMACWNLDVVSSHRRLSEAMAAHHANADNFDVHTYNTPTIRSFDRMLSNTDTLLGPDDSSSVRRASNATAASARSRHSVSSGSSRAMHIQSDTESLRSNHTHVSPRMHKDWSEFHFQITKCCPDDIRSILETHQHPATLVRSVDGSQRTPLHLAAQRDDIELAEVLVSFGADINAKDSEPASVLDFAVSFNNKNFVVFLLDHGVDQVGILHRNQKRFKEIKAIIEFRRRKTVAI